MDALAFSNSHSADDCNAVCSDFVCDTIMCCLGFTARPVQAKRHVPEPAKPAEEASVRSDHFFLPLGLIAYFISLDMDLVESCMWRVHMVASTILLSNRSLSGSNCVTGLPQEIDVLNCTLMLM